MAVKYIFVTGGVVSGLGKGITAASLGRLLKQRGLRVKVQKLYPYLNVDPGTMSPYQHGEVFVTDDGAETDLDLGHYERFIDENLTFNSSVSSGKVYWNVLNRERKGDYLGGTVQIIPHITNEIKRNIYSLDTPDTDVAIVEIGGTVGDIESQPFLESIRQVAAERGRQNVMFLHVSLIVSIPGTGELKSKPTQHSAKELLSLGIQPDVIICRSDAPVSRDILEKISLFCNIPVENAIPNLTADILYEVPLMLEREGLADVVVRRLGLICHMPDLTEWATMVHRAKHPTGTVEIALVGKYVALHDAYLSVVEALTHGGIENQQKVKIRWVDSETVTDENAAQLLAGADGVPDAFFAWEIACGIFVTIPFVCFTALSGLQSIDSSLYEAAIVDGASYWQKLFHITLPLVKPSLTVATVLNIIYVFNSFPIVWTITKGDPASRTDTLVTYRYRLAFYNGKQGEAAAVSVIGFLILLVCASCYMVSTLKNGED